MINIKNINIGKKLTIEKIYIYIFISIFIFSDFLRRYLISFFTDTQIETIYNINYLFIPLFFIFIYKLRKSINIKYLILVLSLVLIQFINVIFAEGSTKYIIFDIIFIVMPLLLFTIKIPKQIIVKSVPKILKILNAFVFTILILGIVDYITDRGVVQFLNNIGFYNEIYSVGFENIQNGVTFEPYRYLSIFGHPLRNAQLFITFYILNFLYNKKFEETKYYILYTTILVVGVVLSNGKTAIVVAGFLIVYTFFHNKKNINIKSISFIVLTAFIFINTKIFKTTILARFKEAILDNNLSSGRNVIFKFIREGTVLPPIWLSRGEGFSAYLIEATNQNIASWEYPFVIFAYDKGILFTIIFYLIFFIPVIDMFKRKKYTHALMYLVFNGYVNIYNGINLHGDYLVQCIFVSILIYYSSIYKLEESVDNK